MALHHRFRERDEESTERDLDPDPIPILNDSDDGHFSDRRMRASQLLSPLGQHPDDDGDGDDTMTMVMRIDTADLEEIENEIHDLVQEPVPPLSPPSSVSHNSNGDGHRKSKPKRSVSTIKEDELECLELRSVDSVHL